MQLHKRHTGFTLVELLVTMGMMSIFMVMLTDVFVGLMSARLESEAASNVATDGRAIAARLEYDIARATTITTPENLNVTTSGITATTATIGWTTVVASDSQVQYGTTTSYGSQTTINPSMVTSHSVGLSGLSNGVLYHFRVLSRDAAGNLTTSADYTFTAGAGGTATHVQTAGITNDGGLGNMSVAFPSNVTAGNLIVASVTWDTSSGSALSSCADNRGNIYSVATNTTDNTNQQALAVCYAPNAAAGATTVTVTFSNGFAQYRRLIVNEYSGILTSSPVDVTATNIANGTTTVDNVTSTAATTTTAGNLIFGVVKNDDPAGDTTMNAGTGFTQRNFVNNKDMTVQDRIQPAAGSIASTQTFGANRRYLAHMVAFKVVSPTQPAKLGATSQQMALVIGGVTHTYRLSSGNLQLVNNNGTNNLNGSEVTISDLSFQRVGNVGGAESVRVQFTVTAVTQPRQGPRSQVFTITAGRR